MKKTEKSVLVFILALVISIPLFITTAFAEEAIEPSPEQLAANSLHIEQVNVLLPEITAYVRLDNNAQFTSQQVSALLGTENLNVLAVSPEVASTEGITYEFFVDVSTSISYWQMESIKAALKDFKANLGSADRMLLYSFGEYITPVLYGGEDFDTAAAAIEGLAAAQQATRLYDAINTAIENSRTNEANFPQRKVAIAISDGIEYSQGSITQGELLQNMRANSLTLYAIGLNTGEDWALNAFGELARQSNGTMNIASAQDIGWVLFNLNNYIRQFSRLDLTTATNIPSAQNQTLTVTLNFGSKTIQNSVEVDASRWIPDTESPVVVGIEQLDNQSIQLNFNKALLGADDPSNYVVTDQDGASIAIQGVKYEERDDTFTATITFEEKLYVGTYSIEFFRITDTSFEANPLTQKETFDFAVGQPIILKTLRTIIFDFWWVILIVVLLIILLIVYLVIKRRKNLVTVDGSIGFGDAVEFQHHFSTPESSSICLVVTDIKGDAKKVEMEINKSIFVGRAKMNNLSFDDAKLSRQHFVIELDKGEFFITDLQTTNGTYLNGVALKGRRLLQEGDVITAGHEKIVFKSGKVGVK